MQSNKNIIDLGKSLPFGCKKKIAKKTQLHYNTVLGYFKGKAVSSYTENIILHEASEYIRLAKRVESSKKNLSSYGL